MNNNQQKIKVWTFVSLDWFTSRMDGDIDWLLDYPHPAKGDYGYHRFLDSISCTVMGGMHYVLLDSLDMWPFSDKPCYVATKGQIKCGPERDIRLLWTNLLDRPSLVQQMEALRQQNTDGDIWIVGGQEIITLLMECGMVDEITVNIIPRTLGNGVPFFNRSGMERDWTPKNVQMFDNGVVQLEYTVNRNPDFGATLIDFTGKI